MMKTFTVTEVDSYVGIPFKDRGRSREGVDCWGLFRLVQKEVFGVDQPLYDSYSSVMEKEVVNDLVEGRPDDWHQIQMVDARPGDGVLMFRAGEYHIGVVVGGGRMLHIERGGSVVESYTAGRFRHHIVGFYRYVKYE
jgi:lipoprotein Spr